MSILSTFMNVIFTKYNNYDFIQYIFLNNVPEEIEGYKQNKNHKSCKGKYKGVGGFKSIIYDTN